MANSINRLHDVFFYGLYMDEEILTSKGVVIRKQRSAYVDDYALRVGDLTTLVRKDGSCAYGMVYAMTQKEVYSLYEGDGLDTYVAEALLCTLDNGSKIAVLCKNLVEIPKDDESNSEYFTKLKKCMEKYGLPIPKMDNYNYEK